MLPYNPNDKQSIIAFAKLLKGKSLREACSEEILAHTYSGKGHFGQILEKFYFLYEPNSESEPDFPVAGIELKSTPLKQLQTKDYRSKERLVLNVINYLEVVNQDFGNSSFWKKNASILLIFYLHQTGYNVIDYIVKLVDEWTFPATDLEIIKKDWQLIKQKIADGKAHELSEADTFYLGACTKGANSASTRRQPFSDIPAKRRAYSLKQGYVNHIIASIANETTGMYGKLITSAAVAKKQTFEDIVISKFKPYFGKTVQQIISWTGVQINSASKSFFANLTKAILGVELKKDIEEFEKAEIVVKTIRVESDDRIIESISFEQFKYLELINESWKNSNLKSLLEHKFLFIFFKKVNDERVLQKAKLWNMPYADMQEARKVWLHTKRLVINGNIVREIRTNGTRKTNFIGKTNNRVAHVRPKAENAADTYPLPVMDKVLQAKEYTKQCFWLNNNYVRDEIYLKP